MDDLGTSTRISGWSTTGRARGPATGRSFHADWSGVVVAGPISDGSPIRGNGWTLALRSRLRAGARPAPRRSEGREAVSRAGDVRFRAEPAAPATPARVVISGAVRPDQHGMLEPCADSAPSAVRTVHPSGVGADRGGARIDHRLDGERHALAQPVPGVRAPDVRDVAGPCAWRDRCRAAVDLDDAAGRADVARDRRADIAEPSAGPAAAMPASRATAGQLDEAARARRGVAPITKVCRGVRRVAVEPRW